MHQGFADWYRIAAIDPRNVDLEARWAGVEAFVKTCNVNDVLDSGRLFFGMTPKSANFADRLRAPFKASDAKFAMLGNDMELRVLAGSLLAALFSYDSGWGETALLTLTCGSFRDQRTAAVGEIVRVAREELSKKSASLRVIVPSALPTAEQFNEPNLKRLDEVRKILNAAGALPTVGEPLLTALVGITTALGQLLQWAPDHVHQQELRREETDVLWWLFAGHSRDLDVGFEELKDQVIALVAAKEMADLTKTIPGPYSARGFLNKALRHAKSVSKKPSLADAVSATSVEWRALAANRADTDACIDLCPVLFAVKKCKEAEGKKVWIQLFEQSTSIKAAAEIELLDLSEQAYEEWLLVSVVNRLARG